MPLLLEPEDTRYTAEPYSFFFLIKHCFKIEHNKCAYYAL